MALINVDLNNISLDDNNIDNDHQKLLFMLVFWLGVINLSNARYVKRDKQIINACIMASNKMKTFLIHGKYYRWWQVLKCY